MTTGATGHCHLTLLFPTDGGYPPTPPDTVAKTAGQSTGHLTGPTGQPSHRTRLGGLYTPSRVREGLLAWDRAESAHPSTTA